MEIVPVSVCWVVAVNAQESNYHLILWYQVLATSEQTLFTLQKNPIITILGGALKSQYLLWHTLNTGFIFFSVHKAYSMYENLQTFNARLGIFLWNGNWDVVEYHYISMTGLIPLVGASGCNPNLLLCESIPSLSFSRKKYLLYKGHKTFHIRSHTPRPKTTFRHLYNKYANEWRKLEIVFLVCH